MGMFDDIRCEYPLPDGEDGTQLPFQSKSLDCTLTTYKIRHDGTLWLLARTGTWEPYYFTGGIEFYHYEALTKDNKRWTNWYYQATFVQGVLQQITGQKTVDRSELEQAIWDVRQEADNERER